MESNLLYGVAVIPEFGIAMDICAMMWIMAIHIDEDMAPTFMEWLKSR